MKDAGVKRLDCIGLEKPGQRAQVILAFNQTSYARTTRRAIQTQERIPRCGSAHPW
jgi:hypothetical protein